MPRRSDEELTRVHLHLFSDDIALLDALFGETIGRAVAIRRIVRDFLERNHKEFYQNKGLV